LSLPLFNDQTCILETNYVTSCRLWSDRQAQICSGGVECKNGLIQFQREAIVPVDMSGALDQVQPEILIPASKVLYPVIPLMSIDGFVEFVTGDDLNELSEDGLLGHGALRYMKDAANCVPKPRNGLANKIILGLPFSLYNTSCYTVC
jgi:hypothetical protein